MRRTRPHILVALTCVAAAAVVVAILLRPAAHDRRRIARALADCRRIIQAGEMGWANEVGHRIDALKCTTADQRRLAEQLLSDPDGDQLLALARGDRRWNYWLDTNDRWSRLCTVAWKLRTNRPLTAEDREAARGYSLVLQNTFGLSDALTDRLPPEP